MWKQLLSVVLAAAVSQTAVAQTFTATCGSQTATFNGATRGYWFIAPADFTITGVQAQLQTGSTSTFQNFAIIKFDNQIPPPTFPTVTQAFTHQALGFDIPQNVFQSVNVSVQTGDVIGIYGNCMAAAGGTTGQNSYAGISQQTITIGSNVVNINRSGMQFHLGSATSPQGMHDVWQEPGSFNITRVDFQYTIGPALPVAYCTAGTTTNGCTASIGANANPSVSAANPCNITISGVEGQKTGIVFYGLGSLPQPWCVSGGTSFLCVKSPTFRSGAQATGGTVAACDGTLSLDWNAFQAANPGSLGSPFSSGQKVYVQGWFRDPPACKSTSLSNALEMTYVP
ncbi:MAG: hypothetical protein NTV21_06125 [Planctomycetota bacterium]|nr:hypothetical protein [Planctomycetota bacterium]